MPTVTVNNVRLAYDDDGEGPPLLLIHGFPLGRWMWDDLRLALRTRCRVIVPDLRGHGDSQVMPGPYLMDLLADDVAALCRELGISRAVVAGLSMGGYIAFSLWRRHASLIRGLILADTRAQADDAGEKVMRLATAEMAQERGTAAVVEGMLPKLLAPGTLAAREELVARVRERLARTDPTGVAGALLGMRERPDSLPTLASITVPTLVVVGADDQLTPPARAQEMCDRLPQARLAVIPDAGHLTPVEQPAATIAAVSRFLDDLG